MHVSSKPIESECLQILSKFYFSNHMHGSSKPMSQSKVTVSEFHQITFFQNYMHVSSKPIKSECLRISSNYCFSILYARFFKANQNRVSHNF